MDQVVLSGGAFQNALLIGGVESALVSEGLKVMTAKSFPVNDGGVALGQAAVASARVNQ